MVKMSEELINDYQNYINYLNADNIFEALESKIDKYGKDFILQDEFDTKEECVNSYVIRANVMRFACDAIEHYAKAILIQLGHNWNESKSLGHNLSDLFNNLDEESRSIIYVTLMTPNTIDSFENNYDNRNKALYYLLNKLEKIYLMAHPEKIKANNINNNLNEIYDKYDYKNLEEKYEYPYIPQEGNIVPIKKDQTVDEELEKLNPHNIPGKPKDQVFGIKSRFPGEYFVKGNAEFLISFAYAMNKLSKIYRNKESDFYRG